MNDDPDDVLDDVLEPDEMTVPNPTAEDIKWAEDVLNGRVIASDEWKITRPEEDNNPADAEQAHA